MMTSKFSYPLIPEKRYFSIGEAAVLVCTKPHILRYWEKEIGGVLKHIRRHNQRRYYNRSDILLLRRINGLIYESGMTLEGVKAALKQGNNSIVTTAANNPEWLRREIEKVIDLL